MKLIKINMKIYQFKKKIILRSLIKKNQMEVII